MNKFKLAWMTAVALSAVGLIAHQVHARSTFPIGRLGNSSLGQSGILLADWGTCFQGGYVGDAPAPYDVALQIDSVGLKTIQVYGRANPEPLTCRVVTVTPSGGVSTTGPASITATGSTTTMSFLVLTSVAKSNVFVECSLPVQCRAFWSGINYFAP